MKGRNLIAPVDNNLFGHMSIMVLLKLFQKLPVIMGNVNNPVESKEWT